MFSFGFEAGEAPPSKRAAVVDKPASQPQEPPTLVAAQLPVAVPCSSSSLVVSGSSRLQLCDGQQQARQLQAAQAGAVAQVLEEDRSDLVAGEPLGSGAGIGASG